MGGSTPVMADLYKTMFSYCWCVIHQWSVHSFDSILQGLQLLLVFSPKCVSVIVNVVRVVCDFRTIGPHCTPWCHLLWTLIINHFQLNEAKVGCLATNLASHFLTWDILPTSLAYCAYVAIFCSKLPGFEKKKKYQRSSLSNMGRF